jgi:glycerol-3-phosphate dehydrogenase
MLHGGIRYLENMDFSLVFEALKEKNLWLKLTPHITKEVPFYLPVYKDSKWPLFFMRIGLFLYDMLSLFKNSPHRVLNIEQTLKEMPGIKSEGLTGSGLYYDGIVDDSKLGLECIYDALNNKKCEALNYKKVIKTEKIDGDIYLVTYKDSINHIETQVTCSNLIFATGPFTDTVMKDLNIARSPRILPSKGIHLWLKQESLPINEAMVLQTNDGRIIFVIPQRNTILVGTTETPIPAEENILNIKATTGEIDYLISVVNDYFPNSQITNPDVLASFAAVRPLVKSSESSSKTSRLHKVFSPDKNMYVIIGGKYTTFRKMAEDLNKTIFRNLGIKHDKSLTLQPLKTTSIVKNPFELKIDKEVIAKILKEEHVRTKADLIERRLSLPSLAHYNDKDLLKILEELELE